MNVTNSKRVTANFTKEIIALTTVAVRPKERPVLAHSNTGIVGYSQERLSALIL
jgi:hypothetical protein